MAQATRSSSTRRKRTSSTGSKSTSRNGRSGTTRSRNGSSSTSKTKVAELAAKTKPQAEKVSSVASKAKAPLIAGGAALAGLAGGVALKSRTENRRPIKGLRVRSLPKSLRNIDLGKVDLDAITDAAHRVRSIGEQVGDVADAAEKTRKKHK